MQSASQQQIITDCLPDNAKMEYKKSIKDTFRASMQSKKPLKEYQAFPPEFKSNFYQWRSAKLTQHGYPQGEDTTSSSPCLTQCSANYILEAPHLGKFLLTMKSNKLL